MADLVLKVLLIAGDSKTLERGCRMSHAGSFLDLGLEEAMLQLFGFYCRGKG